VNATQLAENGRDWSTLIVRYPHGHVVTCVPNHGEQELVAAFYRAAFT